MAKLSFKHTRELLNIKGEAVNKRTPGPWGIDGARWTVLGGPASHRKGICVMSNTHNEEEADANRRLIAAAPTMLEVLERIANSTCFACSAVSNARAVIVNSVYTVEDCLPGRLVLWYAADKEEGR